MTKTLTPARPAALAAQVEKAVLEAPVYDIHTHLYPPAFGDLLLWGIDDLLTYHYLVAEVFRFSDVSYPAFWRLAKRQQADLIWQALFRQHSPLSEACQGVLTTLQQLGLDARQQDLPALRRWFAQQAPDQFVDRCMALAGVRTLCMTNSPFDDQERAVWERGYAGDPRFTTALRLDPLLLAWPRAAQRLHQWGYRVTVGLSPKTVAEARRFLADWTRRIQPRYLMVSLPPDFRFPDRGACARLLDRVVLPHGREHGLPLALMLGVKRGVNPQLDLAGDGVGPSDLGALEHLCAQYPDNKFLVTVLARESQHAAAVIARKFRNLHLFGCWWFTNVPSLVEEITRLRLELLGLSFTPQHSDARVLDQLIYKWRHSRRVMARVLAEQYTALASAGWPASAAEIQRDVRCLFGGAFEEFCGGVAPAGGLG